MYYYILQYYHLIYLKQYEIKIEDIKCTYLLQQLSGRAGGGENMREKADTGLRRCKGSKGPHCDKDSSFSSQWHVPERLKCSTCSARCGGRARKALLLCILSCLVFTHLLRSNSHILSSSEKKTFDFSLELDILSDLIGIKFSFEPLLIKGTAIQIGLL